MTDTTEPDRAQVNAALAKATGWEYYEGAQYGGYNWKSPHGNRPRCKQPPDFFTDAAASRALVEWIQQQPRAFFRRYLERLCGLVGTDLEAHPREANCYIFIESEVKALLTAPLPVVARAAAAAIGGEGNYE